MNERIVRMTIKVLAGAFTLSIGLAQIPAAALPAFGGSAFQAQAPRTEDPRQVVASGFEEIIGRDLNNVEMRQVNLAIRQLEQVENEHRVQRVNFVTELWDRYEKLPILCLYGKFNGKIPTITRKSFSMNIPLSIGYEITPCLVLNSFNPLAWRTREFRSYVMQGGSFGQAGGDFGGVAGGILIGVYAGPKSLSKPMIGTYGFARITVDRGLAKGIAQVAYSDNKQVLAMVGVGGELSFDAILRALKVMPKADLNSVAVGGIRAEVGMYFSVKEFPWFQRLVLQGMNPIDAFADMNTYLAAN